MRAYIDADVLIWHLRGEKRAAAFFNEMYYSKEFELWIGAMQKAEVIFFMRPAEVEATELFLAQFEVSPVDGKIVDTAARLYRKWHPSHGVDINDMLLAATAAEFGGQIFTLNCKHYPIPDIIVKQAW